MFAPDDFWESESLHHPKKRVIDILHDARGRVFDLMAEYGEDQWTTGWNAALYYAEHLVMTHRISGYVCSCGAEVNSQEGHHAAVIRALRQDESQPDTARRQPQGPGRSG